jgi:hypothetical protein
MPWRIASGDGGHKLKTARPPVADSWSAQAPRQIVAENCTVVHLLTKVPLMNAQTLSAYVLKALAEAQSEGRTSTLETLTEAVRVRRGDVRRTLTLLHRQGFVDVLRMRPTLSGFALGRAYMGKVLPPLRVTAAPALSLVA